MSDYDSSMDEDEDNNVQQEEKIPFRYDYYLSVGIILCRILLISLNIGRYH